MLILETSKVSKKLFSSWQKFKKHKIEESSKYDMLSLKRFQRFLKCTSDDHSCLNTWDLLFPFNQRSFKETLAFLIDTKLWAFSMLKFKLKYFSSLWPSIFHTITNYRNTLVKWKRFSHSNKKIAFRLNYENKEFSL